VAARHELQTASETGSLRADSQGAKSTHARVGTRRHGLEFFEIQPLVMIGVIQMEALSHFLALLLVQVLTALDTCLLGSLAWPT